MSWRADPAVVPICDRHYNRQSPGSPQVAPPGRCLVLKHVAPAGEVDAVWITSYPFAEYVRHAWAGAWVCSCFRNESPLLSSELILEAVAATRWFSGAKPTWGSGIPDLGMISFVNKACVRRKRDPGRCYRRAGFSHVGFTQDGLYALQLLPVAMPASAVPLNAQLSLWDWDDCEDALVEEVPALCGLVLA